MPLPKPQAALLFNNYFDKDSITKTIAKKIFQNQDSVPVEQPLDIELILAGAYYNFVNGKGEELGPKLGKKVPFSENSNFKLEYKNIFQIPNNGPLVEIYNPNFVEITTDNINPADLFSEFEVTSGKTLEGNEKTTTIYISSNLYAALDAFFSVGGDEKLAVPFVAGENGSGDES